MAVFRQRQATGSTQRGGDTQRGVAGGITATVGQVLETDTANAITWAPKIRIIGQVSESDLAQSIVIKLPRQPVEPAVVGWGPLGIGGAGNRRRVRFPIESAIRRIG